ncbi:MAG: 2-C-methyl-D-erythritol 4-phosphate cytidylyltransferase [Desulfobacterales bacterium]|nr:MAG: 2-C-methyl-D-erythritol 4-phosphate cytidylyltransferase [Desulfobacterales bacterium]
MRNNYKLNNKPGYSLLLLSGGVGQRSGHHEPKQFYELNGHPMIAYSLMAALEEPLISEIIVNAPVGYKEYTADLMRRYCKDKFFKVVSPGQTRQESCYKLLKASSYDNVVLHEAARPFVDREMYSTLINCDSPNAGYCYPISFSMCKIDTVTKQIIERVSRDEVFNIQLPQKFERSTLMRAHELALKEKKEFTEDALMVVLMTGEPVLSLVGASRNKKVTNPEDFVIAEKMLSILEEEK